MSQTEPKIELWTASAILSKSRAYESITLYEAIFQTIIGGIMRRGSPRDPLFWISGASELDARCVRSRARAAEARVQQEAIKARWHGILNAFL